MYLRSNRNVPFRDSLTKLFHSSLFSGQYLRVMIGVLIYGEFYRKL